MIYSDYLTALQRCSKAHVDQVLAQAKVEVLATSKQWEPQRAYEKRLGNVMSKDKGKHLQIDIVLLASAKCFIMIRLAVSS
jgi:hypothetical protein